MALIDATAAGTLAPPKRTHSTYPVSTQKSSIIIFIYSHFYSDASHTWKDTGHCPVCFRAFQASARMPFFGLFLFYRLVEITWNFLNCKIMPAKLIIRISVSVFDAFTTGFLSLSVFFGESECRLVSSGKVACNSWHPNTIKRFLTQKSVYVFIIVKKFCFFKMTYILLAIIVSLKSLAATWKITIWNRNISLTWKVWFIIQ